MATQFDGLWIPMVTPFIQGKLDLDAAQRLAIHLQQHDIDGLIVCATTGEGSSLAIREQQQLITAVQEAVGGHTPVMLGLSGNHTEEAAATVSTFNDSGLCGVLLTAPYYVRPSQEGIQRHFEKIAAATPMPIVIYNIPYRTGVNITPATIKALSGNPQFAAVKESGAGNLEQLHALIQDTPLNILSGEDALIFITCCLGGHGAISAAAHIRPDLFRQMIHATRCGELELARQINTALHPLIQTLFCEPNPAPIKAALAQQGLIREELRLPMTRASSVCHAMLEKQLDTIMAFQPSPVPLAKSVTR